MSSSIPRKRHAATPRTSVSPAPPAKLAPAANPSKPPLAELRRRREFAQEEENESNGSAVLQSAETVGTATIRGAGLIVLHVIGAFLAFLVSAAVMEKIMPLLEAGCGSVDGMVCNGVGHCLFGRCVCDDATYSGEWCQVSACKAAGRGNETCSGRGACAPYLQYDAIDPRCKWIKPSVENRFITPDKQTGGWDFPACQVYIASLQAKIDAGLTLTDAEQATFPACACFIPYSGEFCQDIGCPQNVALQTCSNNGNVSVGYVDNSTGLPGNGCQCINVFYLLDYADLLSNDTVAHIRRAFPHLLRTPFCGRLVATPSGAYVRTTEDDYACFCDEKHFDKICASGRCPVDEFGNSCSNRGSKLLGFGRETNVSHSTVRTFSGNEPVKCQPLCAPGFVECRGGCEARCVAAPPAPVERCPPSRPFRCRNLQCVGPLDPTAAPANYESGWLDDLSVLIYERCVGIGGCGLNVTSLNTSLIHFRMGLRGPVGGTVTLQYDEHSFTSAPLNDSTNVTFFEGTVPLQPFVDDVDYVYTDKRVHIERTSDARKYVVVPYDFDLLALSPKRDLTDVPTTLRLSSPYTSLLHVMNVESVRFNLVPFDLATTTGPVLVFSLGAADVVITPGDRDDETDATRINVMNCLDELDSVKVCGWTLFNASLVSLDASGNVVKSVCANGTIVGGVPCGEIPSDVAEVRGSLVAETSVMRPIEDVHSLYDLQIPGVLSHVLSFVADAGMEVFDANLVTSNLLVATGSCHPFQDTAWLFTPNNNQSYYNELWATDDSRISVSDFSPEDRVAFPVEYNGRAYYERGVVLNSVNGVARVNVTAKRFVTSVDASLLRRVTAAEYDQMGLLDCPRSFPSRTQFGDCSYPTFETLDDYEMTCDFSRADNRTRTVTCEGDREADAVTCACVPRNLTATNGGSDAVSSPTEDGVGLTCTCSDGDLRLERAVTAAVVEVETNAVCEMLRESPTPVTVSNATGVFFTGDGLRSVTFLGNCNASLEVHELVFVPPPPPHPLTPDSTNVTATSAVLTSCVDGEVEIALIQSERAPYGTWYVMTNGAILNASRSVDFTRGPIGYLVVNATYTASSSTNDTSPSNAAGFDATKWEAAATDRRVWLRMDFPTPRKLSHVLVHVDAARLTFRSGATIPLPLSLEALYSNGTTPTAFSHVNYGDGYEVWKPLTSDGTDVREFETDGTFETFEVDPSLPLVYSVRIHATHPFSIRQFSAYSDFSCIPSELSGVNITIDGMTTDVYGDLVTRLGDMGYRVGDFNTTVANGTPLEKCVCNDACASSRNGVCEDPLAHAAFSTPVRVSSTEGISLASFHLRVFGTPTLAPAPPTSKPTHSPTKSPTTAPSDSPTKSPTVAPTHTPTNPTRSPTSSPTDTPTHSPTNPTKSPSTSPSRNPTKSPTAFPTLAPTVAPTTPTASPTLPLLAIKYSFVPRDVVLIGYATVATMSSAVATNVSDSFLENNSSSVFGIVDAALTGGVPVAFVYLAHGTSTLANVPFPDPSAVSQTGVFTGDALSVVTITLTTLDTGAKCFAGFDCTDCGCSSRLPGTIVPGATCTFTARESIIAQTGDPHIPLSALLYRVSGVTVTTQRTLTRSYEERCPYPRCDDGTCSKDCSHVRYDCPGDGCVQLDPRFPARKCACQVGAAGLRCGYGQCRAAVTDPFAFELSASSATSLGDFPADPHAWCACSGPGGLKIRPPASTKRRKRVDDRELLVINSGVTARTSAGVGLTTSNLKMNNVRSAHGGWAIPVPVRYFDETGTDRQTDCPPAVEGPLGQYLSFEDSMILDSQGYAIHARNFTDLDGNVVTRPWLNITHHNDFRHRCPDGSCDKSPEWCGTRDVKVCSNKGTCMSDGTCRCDHGWTTFFLTEQFTLAKSIPYAVDFRTGIPNPTVWFERNTNWRDYPNRCDARDCTVQDCSIPRGCFAGTPPDFKDKYIKCPVTNAGSGGIVFAGAGIASTSPDARVCARASCEGENLTTEMDCYGRGVGRLRAYRSPPEYYCECGTPTYTVASQTDELIPNGFGGDTCNQYECTDSSGLRFIRSDPNANGRPFIDLYGNPLRGKWFGPCGAHVGPDPDEETIWRSCCPGSGDPNRCEHIPCRIAGQIQCVNPEMCIPKRGTPLVYSCNNHGTRTASGLCVCDVDKATGVGYTADLKRFSEANNCYKAIRCPRAANGNVCNEHERCSDPIPWLVGPNAPYFNDQADIVLAAQGYEVRNETLIRAISDLNRIEKEKLRALVRIALAVLSALQEVGSCICLYPADDCASPFGMNDYCLALQRGILRYDQAFKIPYLIALRNATALLTDGNVTTLPIAELTPNASYFESVAPGSNVSFDFDRVSRISVIRIHALVPLATGSNVTRATLTFDDGNGTKVCTDLNVEVNATRFAWFELYCVSRWHAYDFQILADYRTNCNPDPFSDGCETWKHDTCLSLGNVWHNASEIDEPTRDCTDECCELVEVGSDDEEVGGFRIFVPSSLSGAMLFDEVQVYGYANETLPVPDALYRELVKGGGSAECSATPDQRYASAVLGADGTYFTPTNDSWTRGVQTSELFPDAKTKCVANAGWLAAARVDVPQMCEFDDSHECNPEMADACKVQAGESSNCFVGIVDTRYKVAPKLDEFFLQECTRFGDRFDKDSGPIDYYSARLPEIYLTSWTPLTFVPYPPNHTLTTPLPTISPTFSPVNVQGEARHLAQWHTQSWRDVALELSRLARDTTLDITQAYVPNSAYFFTSDTNKGPNAFQTRINDDWSLTSNQWTFWEPVDFGDFENPIPTYSTPDDSSSNGHNRLLGGPQCSLNLHHFTTSGSPKAAFMGKTEFDPSRRTFRFQSKYRHDMQFSEDITDCFAPRINQLYAPCCETGTAFDPGYCQLRDVDSFGYESFGKDILNDIPTAKRTFGYDPATIATFLTDDTITIPPQIFTSSLLQRPGDPNSGIHGIHVTQNCFAEYRYYDGNNNLVTRAVYNYGGPNNDDITVLPADVVPVQIRVYPITMASNVAWRWRKWKVSFDAEVNDKRDGYNGDDSWTMGWWDKPHMCMRVRYTELAYVSKVTGYVEIANPDDSAVNSGEPSVFATSTSGLRTWDTSLRSCRDMGRPILEARTCEVKPDSFWEWLEFTYRNQGFPKEVMMRRAGIVAYKWRNVTSLTTSKLDYPRLEDMANQPAAWRGFARLSVKYTLDDFRVKFGKDWCGTVSTRLTNYGLLEPKTCDMTLNYVCQKDYAKCVAKPGTVCNICGTSTRLGGGAQTGDPTCIKDFPLANAELYPLEHHYKDLYLLGILNLYALRVHYDFDKVREFYDSLDPATGRTRPYVWGLEATWALWRRSFVTRPGFALTVSDEDPIMWREFATYPVTCPPVVSVRTGKTVSLCAEDAAYCSDPDAILPQVAMDPSDYPTVLLPVTGEPSTNAQCGVSVRPSAYVVLDNFGGPTPGLDETFTVLTADPLGLTFRAKSSRVTLYNTGKNSHLYVFEGSFNVTGSLDLQCDSCTSGVNVTIWLSPVDPTYLYPAQPLVMLQFVATSGAANDYAFTASLPVANESANINATYQTMGWVFEGLVSGATMRVSNAIVSDPLSVARCRTFRGRTPRYERPLVMESTVPDNACIYTEAQRVRRGAHSIGTCDCGVSTAGSTCEIPALNLAEGKFVCGDFGARGDVMITRSDGSRTRIATRTGDDDRGGYSYPEEWLDEEIRHECKCRDTGRIIFTKLLLIANDWPKAFTVDNVYDAVPYKIVSDSATASLSFDDAALALLNAALILPSWVSGDELTQYDTVTAGIHFPAFTDLERHNLSTDGDYDVVWGQRSFPFAHCLESGCDNSSLTSDLETPVNVSAASGWTRALVDAANFNNLLYFYNSSAYYDGNDVATDAATGSVSFSVTSAAFTNITVVFLFDGGTVTKPAACHTGAVLGTTSEFNCPVNTTIVFALSAATVREIQAFSDAMRSDFYDYAT